MRSPRGVFVEGGPCGSAGCRGSRGLIFGLSALPGKACRGVVFSNAWDACRWMRVLEADRAISTARLRGLPRFHLRPIDVVVFHGSRRDLVLRGVSRLDAYSGYPVRT